MRTFQFGNETYVLERDALSNEMKLERILESYKQLTEIKHSIERQGKLPDQNMISWLNALEYCMSDYPMILGKAD